MLIAYGPFSKTRAWFEFGEQQVDQLDDTHPESQEAMIAKEPGRDKAKRQELEAQSAQASLQATAAAQSRAAAAQEVMANSSKSVSQSLAAKMIQDTLKQEREFVMALLRNPDLNDPSYANDLKEAKERVRDYQCQLDDIVKIVVKGVMTSSQI